MSRKLLFTMLVFIFARVADAKITGSLIVHNSRSESISVSVYNAKGNSVGDFSVGARTTKYISIGDTEDGTDWFDAYDAQGSWIKRGSAAGSYSNFDWYVD